MAVAAIGPATAEALKRRGIMPDLMPSNYLSQALVDEMQCLDLKGARVLLPRAEIGEPELALGLQSLGASVDQVSLYRTQVPESSRQKALDVLKNGKIDVATFTSSSTVRHLVELLSGEGELLSNVTVACIGPVTAKTARELGIRVDIVAPHHTVKGLVEALKEYHADKRRQQ